MNDKEKRVKKALEDLPGSIRVGPFDVDIRISRERHTQWWGLYVAEEPVIILADYMKSPQHVVEVFIHEVTHAIFDKSKMEPEDQEERTVATLSIGWTQVYRDNPWLAPWISKHVK